VRYVAALILLAAAAYSAVLAFGCVRNIVVPSHRDSPIPVYLVFGVAAVAFGCAAVWGALVLWRGRV
jgi:hypothetical protein